MKTIGILTSGGDSPGMNTCIAAVVRKAARGNIRTIGIKRGFEGLVNADVIELDERGVSGIAGRGGTILQTSRNGDLKAKLMAGDPQGLFQSINIDSLIVMGGGGSIGAARSLSEQGLHVVAIPCTIDNDVVGTEYTIGFDSACNHVIRAANDIADTAESLEGRIFLIETLGGDTGHIAVASAYAIGADAVIVPEVATDLLPFYARLKCQMDAGKPYAVNVIAEGAGPAQNFVEPIAQMTGRRVRVTTLGHVQRGGPPSHRDRTIARRFGELAVETLISGKAGIMCAMSGGKIGAVPLDTSALGTKPLDMRTYEIVNSAL